MNEMRANKKLKFELYTGYEFYLQLLPYARMYIQNNETFTSLQCELSLFRITMHMDIVYYKTHKY